MLCLIILSSSITFGATINLNYSECSTDGISNNTYCSPSSQILNETLAYITCIEDSNVRLDSINNTFTDFTMDILDSFSNLSSDVSKIKGINLTEEYIQCLNDLNVTQRDVIKWQEETKQREEELTKLQDGTATISNEELQIRDNTITSLQNQIIRKDEDVRNYAILAFIAGIGSMYFYNKRQPSEELGSTEGQGLIPGRG